MNKTIIVKVGTESLAHFHTSEKVDKMIADIARLIQQQIFVTLVSSGAVGCGKEILPRETNKQVLASVGQPILMALYAEKFRQHGIITAQILPTHATLEEIPSHRAQFTSTVKNIVSGWILPIINENDSLSTVEMRELGQWADNDQNALIIARILGATDIILLTNTDGVYRDKDDESTRIHTLKAETITDEWIHQVCWEKSTSWTGGMQSKLKIGKAFSESGMTHICDGIHSGVYEHAQRSNIKGGTRITS